MNKSTVINSKIQFIITTNFQLTGMYQVLTVSITILLELPILIVIYMNKKYFVKVLTFY